MQICKNPKPTHNCVECSDLWELLADSRLCTRAIYIGACLCLSLSLWVCAYRTRRRLLRKDFGGGKHSIRYRLRFDWIADTRVSSCVCTVIYWVDVALSNSYSAIAHCCLWTNVCVRESMSVWVCCVLCNASCLCCAHPLEAHRGASNATAALRPLVYV